MTSSIPYEIYEERAAEQRRRLHNDVTELRSAVAEKLDVKRTAREYLWQATGVASLIALTLGWGIAGIFTRD